MVFDFVVVFPNGFSHIFIADLNIDRSGQALVHDGIHKASRLKIG